MSATLVVKDHGFTRLFHAMKSIEKGKVKVGVLADDEKGSQDHGGLTTAELAAVLHFGNKQNEEEENQGEGKKEPHIKARPFLFIAFDEQREELVKLGKELMEKILDGKMTTERALDLMGAKLAAEAKKVITAGGKLEPNKPSTIAKKGSSKPLIDESRLLGAITWAPDKGHGH